MAESFFTHTGAPPFAEQIVTEGVRSTFRNGAIYRYPGIIPLLEVSGDHAEMGLQYGALLRPEILSTLQIVSEIIAWTAQEAGAPPKFFADFLITRAVALAQKLPQRFRDEAHGISQGAGIPVEAVYAVAMLIDVIEGKACTGVLMPTGDGSLIHGRNNDTSPYGGEMLGKVGVMVRHIAPGYHVVTHVDYPLFLGVSSGYNDQRLTHSEETLTVRQPDPEGFPLYYLIRMGMEECSSLDELSPLFDTHLICGASGSVWGDQKIGRGAVFELTPQAWRKIDMPERLSWNFNHIYSPDLKKYQHPRQNLVGSNWDREALAGGFPQKSAYTVRDAVEFLRLQIDPNGLDYSWYGTHWPICNLAGQQTIIFDPYSDGVYVSIFPYYSARQTITHIHHDFSSKPEEYMPAVALPPLVEAVAKIENALISRAEKISQLISLANEHPTIARLQFLAGYYAYLLGQMDLFAPYVEKAYQVEPDVPEHRLCAGMAAYYRGNYSYTVELLAGIKTNTLNLEQELRRLTILAKAHTALGEGNSQAFLLQRQAILDAHNAVEFFETVWLPQITLLERPLQE